MKARILTALALIPLVILAILYLNNEILAGIFALITLGGAWEWSRLCGIEKPLQRYGSVLVVAILLAVSWFLLDAETTKNYFLIGSLYSAIVWWVIAIIWMVLYSYRDEKVDIAQSLKLLVGFFILTVTWVSLVSLKVIDPKYVLLMMFLIWGADSGAYFSGRFLGKRKLAEKLSPKKTIEGAIGGALASLIIFIASVPILNIDTSKIIYWVILVLLIVAVSIIGDLFESMIKRLIGIKDSGNILPGHGGVLDRVDSLMSSSPIFLLGLMLFGV